MINYYKKRTLWITIDKYNLNNLRTINNNWKYYNARIKICSHKSTFVEAIDKKQMREDLSIIGLNAI